MKTKMSKAQKRVAIAKDVIKWINSESVRATTHHYFRFNSTSHRLAEENEELYDVLNENVETCSVCAKGAMFFCHLKRFDNFTIKDLGNRSILSTNWFDNENVIMPLLDTFSHKQLDLIEYAYQCASGVSGGENTYPKKKKALVFGCQYQECDKERMIAIMKNIIKNGGTFKP